MGLPVLKKKSQTDTSYLMITSIAHFHIEAKILTVLEHLDMLCSVYGHLTASGPPLLSSSRRRLRAAEQETLFKVQSRFRTTLWWPLGRRMSHDGTVADAEGVRKDIHTAAVRDSYRGQGSKQGAGRTCSSSR